MRTIRIKTLAIGIAVLLFSSCFSAFVLLDLGTGSSLFATSASAPPGPGGPGGGNSTAYTINQTLSDEAQRNTIAFDALAFLTGSLGADSFFPPGKVADFWGFQYLRDNDPSQMGHNTDFLTKAANNMLYILNSTQRAQLVTLAESQVDLINEYGYERFVLMKAFRRLLEGNVPLGSTGLNLSAVEEYSAQLYLLDGQISFQRGTVMGDILRSLNQSQRSYLDSNMVGKGMLSWPNVTDQLDPRDFTHDVHVAIMTYAGDLFSWYAGSVEADTYFCPERQGTYFGSFYLKDAPAIGNPNYSIPTNLTGDMGNTFLSTLNAYQAEMVTRLVDIQKPFLYEIVDLRREIATQLRRFIAGESPDNATVQSLMESYGELDGEIVYNLATSFANVNQTLSTGQKAQLVALRGQIGNFTPSGAFLYSTPISMPSITNTDFLFNASITIHADINGDGTVDIYDAIMLANAYNSEPGDPNWNVAADVNSDNKVDIYDAILLANRYNQHYP